MKEREEDAGRTADKIREKFRALYLKDGVRCAFETRTAYTLMIAYGILSEDEERLAVERLVSLIRENGSKMKVGILGAREIFHVLSRHGYGDLALYMIADGEFPSYGEWVKRGQTALWERFYPTEDSWELKRVGGGELTSVNHHMFGDITHWFKERVLGIFVNPKGRNCRDILIKPCDLSDMKFAEGGYKRAGASVSVKWKKDGKDLLLSVKKSGEFKIRYDFSGYDIIEYDQTAAEDYFAIRKKK
jgi:alpha-L-rhamnosidase